MFIVDVFEIKGKKAVYCTCNNIEKVDNSKKVIINNTSYKIIKNDIMTSLTGKKSVALLLDTTDNILPNQEIYLN